MRKNIYDILKNAKISVEKEYERLFALFYNEKVFSEHQYAPSYSIAEYASVKFREFDSSFIGRTTSLTDFKYTYGYNFESASVVMHYAYKDKTANFPIDYFLKFCEFSYNIAEQLIKSFGNWQNINSIIPQINYWPLVKQISLLKKNIISCLDDLNYKIISKDGIYIIIESSAQSLSVAEIVSDELSYTVLEYNHFLLKGNLIEKKRILKFLADDIEKQRPLLKNIGSSCSEILFQLLQKFVRHNNEKNKFIMSLSDDELEKIYDDIYQMWLLAKLEIDNVERKRKSKELLNHINT